MNIQDVGDIGEIIAAIATVITLIYVAAQIRQNTDQHHGDAIVAINNTEKDLVERLLEDPELIAIFVKASSDWESLPAKAQARAHLYLHAYARWCETCWLLWQRGGLDDTTYASRKMMTIAILTPPGVKTWWAMVKIAFDPRFVEQIDDRLAELGDKAPALLDILPFYHPKFWADESAG